MPYQTHGFPPFYKPDSRILILGSFPSVKSREQSFYYGHPQNRFWQVLAQVYNDEVPRTREEKETFLIAQQIALYDVIESCRIEGSADSSIRDVTPADLAPILAATKVENRIYTNGRKANDLYARLIEPTLHIPATYLPSTSPANAAWSVKKLISAWKIIQK